MSHLLFIFMALFAIASPALGQSTEAIDRMFADYSGDVPSASVGVIKDGELIIAASYGQRLLEDEAVSTTRTNYRLASLTKAFTAMAVVILAEREMIDYEASVRTYIDFPSYGRNIKIRHLLNHQSGLVDYEGIIPSGQSEQLTDHDVVELLRGQRSTYFTPGSQYRYSNGGYAMLAVIVSEVSGMSFEEFLQTEIFMPLGMERTIAYVDGVNEVEERAYGYSVRSRRFVKTDQSITSAVLGDGGVYSSIEDLFIWDQALYSGGGLISTDSLERVFSPGILNSNRATEYGFGWVVDRYRGVERISHTGSTIGQRSSIQRFPSKNLTVIVLMNRANVAPWNYARDIADMYWD